MSPTRLLTRALVLLLLLSHAATASAQDWKPAAGPLTTPWTAEVDPANPRPEYPRPQMVRDRWQSLNGLWDYCVELRGVRPQAIDDGRILVPFAIESMLSGVGRQVGQNSALWYRRGFVVPDAWAGQRVLLHFGAVDWEARVWVDGQEVGSHYGGYDPFSFDITDALDPGREQHEITVAVWDPTSEAGQAIGKQHALPHGIWYTPVTGIWQTVWLEPVPPSHVTRVKLTPNVADRELDVRVEGENLEQTTVRLIVLDKEGGAEVSRHDIAAGVDAAIKIDNPTLWSPENPHLYGLRVQVLRGDAVVDSVDSYFAMRSVGIGPDASGTQRLLLNGEPVFHYGPLDQGWWPDGLYTAPTHEAMVYDIHYTLSCGFNMIRKHVKVEPATWYYECDKLGVLVWQDMPNMLAGREPSPDDRVQYELEWKRIMDGLHHFPSIVMWVPFNEGWGQYDTVRVTEWTKRHDPSRIVNNASGWFDRGAGDVHDIHVYPGPGMPPLEEGRAAVLGEFGGLGLPLPGHIWQAQDNWGYRTYQTHDELHENYANLITNLEPLVGLGLAAAVYTQTTDVEIEVNGLLTYDRRQTKFDPAWLAERHASLYTAMDRFGSMRTLAQTSQQDPQRWRYTLDQPPSDWASPGFNDRRWRDGEAGFGTEQTPGSVVATRWDGRDIWLRRTFEIQDLQGKGLGLWIHHDEDVEVYLNGKLIHQATGWTTDYVPVLLPREAIEAAREGENVLAVHCRQNGGGQYIDVGVFSYDDE